MASNLQRARVLEQLPTDIEADDAFDAILMAMALIGEADHLVSGDHCAGLIQRGDFSRTLIVTPGMFSLKPFEAGACSSFRLTVSSGANLPFRKMNAAGPIKFRHTAINFVATYLRLLL